MQGGGGIIHRTHHGLDTLQAVRRNEVGLVDDAGDGRGGDLGLAGDFGYFFPKVRREEAIHSRFRLGVMR